MCVRRYKRGAPVPSDWRCVARQHMCACMHELWLQPLAGTALVCTHLSHVLHSSALESPLKELLEIQLPVHMMRAL